ncbi:putative quinol monooxygenase [Ileibacterium valens]|uniref:putative quinol monooxygenase n=1 Tax=Ileibacterium valens TaxID=1862668 RepID=UPI0023579D6D|nr:putative quinol monooxygenase [Ileibacterium valens]
MSILIHLFYTGEGDNARKFAMEMESRQIAKKIREEEGNIRYEYFFPFNDPHSVLLIDEWENQEAIDLHHASNMMKDLAELRDKYDLHMKIQRYISDQDGIPERDQNFLRK